VQLGLSEADAFNYSSILIYYNTEQSIYTQMDGLMQMVIKRERKLLSTKMMA
jgi:hypothetical protein